MRISDWSSDVCSSDIHVEACDSVENRSALETRLRTLLHEMAAHPLAEFLLRVTATFYHAEPASDTHDPVFTTADAVTAWQTGKRRMMQEIAEGDVERPQVERQRGGTGKRVSV